MRWLKLLRGVLWGVIAGVSAALLIFYLHPGRQSANNTLSQDAGQARIGGSFTLATVSGRPFSDADLVGRPYLVFFGFTHCPDVCPTTLYELTGLLAGLGADAEKITPLFVTVDPERDTPELLGAYMSAFDPRIVALRGTPEQTEKTLKVFAAYAKKVEGQGGDYTMEHSARVILIDAGGNFAGTLDLHEPKETQLAKLRRLVAAAS